MELKLKIYEDESLVNVKRVAEADRLKIPYRVAIYIAQSLENVDFKSDEDIFKFIVSNLDKLDKVVKATFGLSETELECVDLTELGAVGVELYKWGIEKIQSLKGGNDEKNSQVTA